jgi:hypothetical protein
LPILRPDAFRDALSSVRPYGALSRVRICLVFRLLASPRIVSDFGPRGCDSRASIARARLEIPRCLGRLSPSSLSRKKGDSHTASRVGLRVASAPFGAFSPEGGDLISRPRNLNAFPLSPLSFDKRASSR